MPAARSGAAARERRPRREPPERKPRRSSDLLRRILVAIPLAVATIIFIDLGGLPFLLFMLAAGLLCMYELYALLERWRPVSLLGFLALAGMMVAARSDGQGGVLGVMVAVVPVLLLAVVIRDQPRPTVAIGGTLLGVYWIGLAFAHVELLRQLEHGNGILLDVLIGTFVGDTAAYAGGRLFGRRPLAPQDLAEQDGRGPVLRDARRGTRGVHRGPVPDVPDPGQGARAGGRGRSAGAAW